MHKTITSVLCAALAGCGFSDFNPDLGSLDGTETSDSTTDVGTADTGSETDTSGSTTSETDTGSTDETGSTGDGDGSTGDGDGDTTGGVAECGNGIQEGNEECDDEDLGEGVFACSHVGFWLGYLGCHEDCTYDVSQCSEGLPQPEDGNLWSDCDQSDPQSCNNALECTGGLGNPAGYFCTQSCEHVSECGALPGGTATVICDQMCLISCESGNCPLGMTCQFSGTHDQSLCF